jgi:hypothetical protein
MGACISGNFLKENDESDSLIKEFDIENGFLGIKRDRFLLLIGHMSLENTDKKTRSV